MSNVPKHGEREETNLSAIPVGWPTFLSVQLVDSLGDVSSKPLSDELEAVLSELDELDAAQWTE